MLTTWNWKQKGVASLTLLTAAVTLAFNVDAPLTDADLLTWVELTLSLAGTAALAVTAFRLAAAKDEPAVAPIEPDEPANEPALHIKLPQPLVGLNCSDVVRFHFQKLEAMNRAAEAYSDQPNEANRLAFVDAVGMLEAAILYLNSHLSEAGELEVLRAARDHTAHVDDYLLAYADTMAD